MTLAQQRIAETVDLFYDGNAPMAVAGVRYKDAVDQMDKDVKELDEVYRKTVLDPIGRLIGTFPDFNESIKKRERKIIDYDRTRSTVRKLVDRPSEDSNRLPRAEAEAAVARDLYEDVNQKLIHEIPQLIDLRVDYLHPSFEALVKSQLKFNEFAFQRLESVKQEFQKHDAISGMGRTPEEAALIADRALEGQVDDVLMKMKELTICGYR
ncbi:hypothetical protein HK096_007107 [Nowakowskiella sp. JEL0078]|nr:hypothetical protein HK096_007107 [Nowakowskiella sp. JEL0078]